MDPAAALRAIAAWRVPSVSHNHAVPKKCLRPGSSHAWAHGHGHTECTRVAWSRAY